jgi:hypothetical protein
VERGWVFAGCIYMLGWLPALRKLEYGWHGARTY